ncbi:hypothetical protein ACE38W_13430 [Chitinophaga sp. Hz27]|uniref:hypothetical protein n=1 Tax=Chitinophaga sp. Hz27 TaxID=3347169 RepID=UPI0035D8D85F
MKYFFLVAYMLTVFTAKAQQQPFVFKDRINSFSITIPSNWSYRKPDTTTIAVSAKSREILNGAASPDVFNVAVLPLAGMSSDEAFEDIQSKLGLVQYRTVAKGVYQTGRQKLLWVENIIAPVGQFDSAYVACFVMSNRFNIYVISCTTTAIRYKQTREVFHAVAKSFRCTQLPAPETFTISLPDDNVWVTTNETKTDIMTGYYVHLERQTMENYTTAVMFMRIPPMAGMPFKALVKDFVKTFAPADGAAKVITITEEADKALFKQYDPKEKECSLFYFVKGKLNIHLTSFMARNRDISPEEIEKWIGILKAGKLVTE